MPHYWSPAAICLRGHVATDRADSYAHGAHCEECGALVITTCRNCHFRIRGIGRDQNGVAEWGGDYAPPQFCDKCGAPHPWAGRKARIYELMNQLDAETLDPADALRAREHLEALLVSDPDDDVEQAPLWGGLRRSAPGLWERSGARSILESVVSPAIKSQLGL